MYVFNHRHAVAPAVLIALMAPALHAADGASTAATPSADSDSLETITITAARLNEKRAGIQTQTGASTYVIDDAAIAATPGGDNTLLNQVILQAPDVAQDSFGQLHVRGDHNDLQYRLNGIILPEGISVFGQSLSPRLISSLQLITGALPAQYGLRTAGIIDMTTKSGELEPGGSVSVYGGSHSTFEPSIDYGGRDGSLNYFVSADALRNDLGIESPDGSSNPLHDHTSQYHGFAYFEDILDPDDRLSVILGAASDQFQIPNRHGLQPDLGLAVDGITEFPSADLNENQRELTSYEILSWQHAQDDLDWQSSITSRYSSLDYDPDAIGDLLYNGIAQSAYKHDLTFGWQTDLSDKLNEHHTLRTGLYLQHDNANTNTNSLVLATNSAGQPLNDVPMAIIDDGSHGQWIQSGYLQDEWKALSQLTVNYGVRFDHYSAYSSGSQLSPRLNAVWQTDSGTTLHAGYSRYFTPPPFELVGGESVAKFVQTTAAPEVLTDTAPVAERSSYLDVGAEQKIHSDVTLGVDSYYRRSQNLIDEGQFGAPIILTPFNYLKGKIEGIEFTANYAGSNLSTYANLAFESATGRDIESAQFNFSAADLAYIASNYIHLDHEQRATASAGASYQRNDTRLSADMLFGTGLRADLVLPDGSSIPNGAHLPTYTQINLGASHEFRISGTGPLTLRLDLINALNKIYEIRDGTGVGVGAPQYGAGRGLFAGVSKEL